MSDSSQADGVPCMWMRGGTSKGGYFLADDLPDLAEQRDAFLLQIMGSPDPRQIDGMGGADPLTSKVAVIRPSERPDVDVNYLFLQVFVDKAIVTDGQNCGNILAGVGPFAIERGLVAAQHGETPVAIFMENTGQVAVARVSTPDAKVSYRGSARIDGVPGEAAAVPLAFRDTAGSTCGALLPTGNAVDVFDGISVTCIDNGMPTIVLKASDFGLSGEENSEDLDVNADLKKRLESIRLQAGGPMNLGDVSEKTVPKMSLVSPPRRGGTISTRTFIPHRCHASIGVLGAVSVATACLLPEGPAAENARFDKSQRIEIKIEHPIGEATVILDCGDDGAVTSAAILRTARKLFDGVVFGK